MKEEVETKEDTESINKEEVKDESVVDGKKSSSKLRVLYNNLSFYLSHFSVLFISAGLTIICSLAITFFAMRRKIFEYGDKLWSSCTLMIILFSFFLILSALTFIFSIYFVSKRVRKK